MPLYQHITGDAWAELGATVRRFHSTGAAAHANGSFSVRHGSRLAARVLARLLRLPAAGERVRVRLVVTPQTDGERWQRSFDGKLFVTEQRVHADRLLAERMGRTEIRFRLAAEGSALCYRQTRAAIRLCGLLVPLPRRLSPQVCAREWAAKGETRLHVAVSMKMPLVGLVIAYEGCVEMEETAS
jgi:hypothetical protein